MANSNAQPSTPVAQPLVANDTQAASPADNALEDVCVIEGEKVESTEMIERPPLGETREVTLEQGHNYIFGFNQADAESFIEEDGTLTITFDCGGKLVLNNYRTAVSGDDAATFAFSDVVPQGELASLIKVVDTTEEPAEEPEAVLRKAAKNGNGEQDVSNIEPAAGEEAQAQQLAQIQPAAGEGPAGGAQNSGYGFNSAYAATPVGPLTAVGPLGATELGYNAGFREPNPLVGEDEENDPLLIGPNSEFIDESNLVNGNIVETGSIAIDYGADGPGSIGPNGDFFLSGSALNNALTSNGVPVVVTTDPNGNGYIGVANGLTVFKLEIQSPSGNYTFTLFEPLDHADPANPNDQIGLTFGVIARDADGDTVSTSMTVVVADAAPTLANDGTKSIDEDDLSPTASVTGDLSENFSSDGPGNIHPTGTSNASGDLQNGTLTSGGVAVVISPTANGYVGTANGQNVFTLVINPTTGAYTFTLLKPLDHVQGNGANKITLTFGAEIVDYDGDKAQANIVIDVVDDVPELPGNNTPEVGKGLETVDETNLGPITVNGAVAVDFGGDGPGSFGGNGQFTFNGSATNNTLTSNGVPVVVTQTATGYVGKANGVDVFTITINNNGTYSFTLLNNLDHADGNNPNDSIQLQFGITVTDKDGDTASGKILVNVLDDVPTIAGDGVKVIDEDDIGNPATVSGNLVEDFGEDGPGNIHPNGQTNATGDLANGALTSNGVAVVTTATANGYVGTANGQNVFTLTIDPTTGAYTFTLLKPLDHVQGNGTNTITLNFGAEIVDYDGDKANTNIVIQVKDDVPELPDNNNPAVGKGLETVDETNLGPITVNGAVPVDFGGDGPGSFGSNGVFTSTGSKLNGALTSNGVAVIVTQTATGYVGKANGQDVFTMTINNDGSYSFTLLDTLDHADGNNPNDSIQLQFGVQITDDDGDSATGSIRVNVLDDGPVAVDDGVFTNGPTLNGNVLTNDDPGSDGLGAVVSITFNGNTTNIAPGAAVVVNGNHGTLTISSNGVYQYVPNGNNDGTDEFTYTMDDYDNDQSNAKLTIRVDNDDTPILIDPAAQTVDETDLGPIAVNGVINGNFFTDGPGTFATTGDFSSEGSRLNNGLTSNGVAVIVTATATGYVGTANGQNVFTLTINPTTGAYTFTLLDTLDHADGSNPNDVITLKFGIKGTDQDGDFDTTTITINVLDDAPSIAGDGAKSIDEGGSNVVTGDLIEDFGNDGPGNIHPNGQTSATGDVKGGVLSSGGVPVVITATANGYVGKANGVDVFTLSINPTTGQYTFTLLKPLDHTTGNGKNVITLNFGAEIVDYDGDKASANIVINVTDDVPELPGNNTPEVGKGLETVDETNLGPITVNGKVPVDFGGDGPGSFGGNGQFISTGSKLNNNLTSNGVAVVITQTATGYVGKANGADVFTLTLGNDGSYSFTQFKPLDHADGSNPDDTITLQFGVKVTDSDGDDANGNIIINVKDDGPVAVDDGAFTGGQTLNGNVLTNDDPGSDGLGAVISVTFNGNTTAIADGATVNLVGTYGTLTISSNGAYTYVPKGGTSGTDQFTYTMDDYDNDTSSAKLTINVDNDDQPILVKPATEVVDETDLGPIVETGTVTGNFGNDGPGTFTANDVFSSTGSKLNGTLTSNGVAVVVTSTPTGYVGKAGAVEVFTLTLQSNGQYTFTLKDTLDHADGNNPNDVITLNFGVKGTDTDGDFDTTTITVNVLDDAPSIAGDGAKSVEESGSNSVSGDLAEDFGNDGAGTIRPNGQSSASGEVANGTLSSGGVPVVITTTANGYVGKANGVDVFTLTINPTTGAYTFTSLKALDHTAGNGKNVITLHFGAEIVDYDGDKASTNIVINVTDDVPTLPGNNNPTVGGGYESLDETNLGPTTVNGKVPVDFGGDGPGTFGSSNQFTSTGSKLNNTLTSNGTAVIVTQTATGYVGKANGQDVFTLTINNDGSYSFTQFKPLDHADGSNPNDVITLNFGVKVTDKDGDSTEGTIKIDIKDDAPVANDDTNTSQSTTATGNVITGQNGGPGAADDLSNDLDNKVTKVTFGNTTVNVPSSGQATINGTHGVLKISADGSYTYTSTSGGRDVFTYTLTDGDGDSDTAKLTLNTVPDTTVDITVNNGADKICIKEDSQGTVPVKAVYTGGDGDEVLTLKVTGINSTWVVTAPGWTNQGGGVYTLTLPTGQRTYDGNFTFKPPADSDVDMKGLVFTASVHDPDTNTTKTDTENFTVQVDAVVDTPTLSVPTNLPLQNWYVRNEGYQVNLNIGSKVTDTDGSEKITKILIDLNERLSDPRAPFFTLDDMGIGLNKGKEISPGIWEISVNAGDAAAALSGLKLVVPDNKDYWQIHTNVTGGNQKVNIIVKTYVTEKVQPGDGNGECDFTDNQTVVIKSFALTFRITPLVLDLNGNGIELVPMDEGVMFDMNNNGTLDKTSWVKATDGMLAIDTNHDGQINNQSELFGNNAEFSDGFANLAQYDANKDGKIDSQDAVYKDLLVWRDLNQDGVSQSNEQFKLKDLGIESININANETDITIGDSYISHQSTYTTTDGKTHNISDVSFNVIEGNDIHVGAEINGTDGKDIIYGTENNDVIAGGQGLDVLFGSGGDDVFAFNSFDGSVDTIKDFDAGDVLDITGLLQGYDPVQDSINDFVFRTEVNGNTVISVDASGQGNQANATAIAVLEGATGLDLNDIIQAQQSNV